MWSKTLERAIPTIDDRRADASREHDFRHSPSGPLRVGLSPRASAARKLKATTALRAMSETGSRTSAHNHVRGHVGQTDLEKVLNQQGLGVERGADEARAVGHHDGHGTHACRLRNDEGR